jgi:predicted ATPase/DNA-binding winged helix-turn-helix (wHTH) protein
MVRKAAFHVGQFGVKWRLKEEAPLSAEALAYRFGRCRLLPAERRLLVDGEAVRLGERAFDLLLALVEQRGRTVAREALFERAWPGRVVEDQNLKVQVLALRKLLGAQAIETVPGRGYRFALPIDDDLDRRGRRPPPAPPPPRAPQSNLPAAATPLFGRVGDIAALCRLLQQHRLVSIVGPGGVGKTRVAQAVAHQLRSRFADGVWLVELASLSDPGELAASVGRTLGVASMPGSARDDEVAHALRAQSLLVVLDNCEHLLEAACRFADALLDTAPNAALLATTQEPLKHAAEHVYRLGGLDVPPGDTAAAQAQEHGAVALLAARAQAADPRFRLDDAGVAAAVALCRALDGNALAIELAAARVPVLGVAGVRDRLDARLSLLTRGARNAPARQQTLRAALQWSHGLLSPAEQAVFRRLGVFAGSFSLQAAQRVAHGAAGDDWELLDHLGALVDKSLVVVESGEPPRYRLLESARAFAAEQLDAAGEGEAARDALMRAMQARLHAADHEYLTLPSLVWLDGLLPDLDNLRAALDTALRRDPPAAADMAARAAYFFVMAGLGAEGERACAATRATVDADDAPPALRARHRLATAHLGMGWMLTLRTALDAAADAVALYRTLDDPPRLYQALRHLIALLERDRRIEPAQALLEEMRRLERADWAPVLLRQRRWTEAHHLKLAGDIEGCRAMYHDDMQRALDEGDERASWIAAHNTAIADMALDRPERGYEVMAPAVQAIRERGLERQFAVQIAMMANVLVDLGDLERAAPVVRESVSLLLVNTMLWWFCDALSCVPALAGNFADAARLHGWADAQTHKRAGGQRGLASLRLRARVLALMDGRIDAAQRERLAAEGASLDDDAVAAIVLRALP